MIFIIVSSNKIIYYYYYYYYYLYFNLSFFLSCRKTIEKRWKTDYSILFYYILYCIILLLLLLLIFFLLWLLLLSLLLLLNIIIVAVAIIIFLVLLAYFSHLIGSADWHLCDCSNMYIKELPSKSSVGIDPRVVSISEWRRKHCLVVTPLNDLGFVLFYMIYLF